MMQPMKIWQHQTYLEESWIEAAKTSIAYRIVQHQVSFEPAETSRDAGGSEHGC